MDKTNAVLLVQGGGESGHSKGQIQTEKKNAGFGEKGVSFVNSEGRRPADAIKRRMSVVRKKKQRGGGSWKGKESVGGRALFVLFPWGDWEIRRVREEKGGKEFPYIEKGPSASGEKGSTPSAVGRPLVAAT